MITPIGPTKPDVPIPEDIGEPFISILNTLVARAPVIALVNIGGIHVLGFLAMFGICNMEVPIAWAVKPPQLLSLLLMAANPIIWAQHPARAAPPAKPAMLRATAMTAELIGKVRHIPIKTAIIAPIRIGCLSIDQFMM